MTLSKKILSCRCRCYDDFFNLTYVEASHFPPDLVLVPASQTLMSLASLKVTAPLHLATLDSSMRANRES